jgi:hypothetical protein
MSYELTNFHQNIRHYVQSRDDRQLNGEVLGKDRKALRPDKDCDPESLTKGNKMWTNNGVL